MILGLSFGLAFLKPVPPVCMRTAIGRSAWPDMEHNSTARITPFCRYRHTALAIHKVWSAPLVSVRKGHRGRFFVTVVSSDVNVGDPFNPSLSFLVFLLVCMLQERVALCVRVFALLSSSLGCYRASGHTLRSLASEVPTRPHNELQRASNVCGGMRVC